MNQIQLLFLVILASCSSIIKDKDLRIVTTPDDALVSFYSDEKKYYVPLGKTPLKLPSSAYPEELKKNQAWLLKVERPGFVTSTYFLTDQDLLKNEIHVEMKQVEWWNDPENKLSSLVVQNIGTKIQQIYRSIRLAKYNEALSNLAGLIEQYPQAAILFDMKGSIHLLQGNKKDAIASFERSLQLHSDNIETKELVERLRK